ncbi:MAG: metalloregulator ArsR/SmtB family transcription factor [Solirubrobacteraceae bacterium]
MAGRGPENPGSVFGAVSGDWFAHGNAKVTVNGRLPSNPVPRPASNPFDALADPHRREILELLHDGSRSVREIADDMPFTRPAVSRHLRLLKEAGIVTSTAEGIRRLYQLHDLGLDAVRAYLREVWGDAATRFRLVADNTDAT